MQDSKDNNRAGDYGNSVESRAKASASESGLHAAPSAEVYGWQQYRRWISKVPAPHVRRTGVDPSLYTWKGYRKWTEQVKRNWTDS